MNASLFLLALIAAAVAASDVLDLTESNFDSSLKNVDLALVEFFAPWCGHCKKLTPEYEKAATTLKKSDPPVTLAKVDATVHGSLASKFGVTGYPTLKIFRNGVESGPYEGPRTASGIVKYMEKQSQPASRNLESVADAEKFLGGSDYAVVGFFSSEDSKEFKAYKSLSDGNRDDFRFAHTFNADVTKKYGEENSVVVFQPKVLNNKFEEKTHKFSSTFTVSSLKDFVTSSTKGLVPVVNPDNESRMLAKKPVLVVFFDLDLVKNPSGVKYIRNRVLKVASEVTSELNFAVANTADFPQHMQGLGLAAGEARAAIFTDSEKFRCADVFSMDSLKSFIGDFEANKLESYVKSEPEPASNDGPVKILTGKNFKSIVEDSDKDVLVEFYAPWCGHCKSLAPKWDELGEKLKDDDNIVIAKMDATANDYPSKFGVRGYPTIYFSPKGNKASPKKYEGAREVADFLKFLKENASSAPVVKDEL